MYIKTSGGYKKKLIVKSIAFTNKDIKYSEKEISSEGLDNCEKLITYNKCLSTPLNLNLNAKFDRNMNIPIKQSNLDDSVSDGSDCDIIIPKISGITSNKLHQLSTNSNKCMSANALSPERVVFTQTNSPGIKCEATQSIYKSKEWVLSTQYDSTAPSSESNKNKNLYITENARTIKSRKLKEIELEQSIKKKKFTYNKINEMFKRIKTNQKVANAMFARSKKAKSNFPQGLARLNYGSCKTIACSEMADLNLPKNYNRDGLVSENSNKRFKGIKKNSICSNKGENCNSNYII